MNSNQKRYLRSSSYALTKVNCLARVHEWDTRSTFIARLRGSMYNSDCATRVYPRCTMTLMLRNNDCERCAIELLMESSPSNTSCVSKWFSITASRRFCVLTLLFLFKRTSLFICKGVFACACFFGAYGWQPVNDVRHMCNYKHGHSLVYGTPAAPNLRLA